VTLAVAAPLLCVLALVLGLVEIEIEGPYGWAEKLPTPYRVSGPLARLFGLILGGKPLTGYNLLIFVATLLFFHLPFAFGAPWTAARELAVLAAWVSWSALWDFLWFAHNPAYGWRRFRPGNVWWHSRWLWRLPLDYFVAAAASLALAAAAQLAARGAGGDAASAGGRQASEAADPLVTQAVLLAVFFGWAVLNVVASPLLMRLHRHTHAASFDERGRVPIAAPPEDVAPRRESVRPGEAPPPGRPHDPE
jgi:multisubunit Na+/H+ antiporter MnhC subunit